jgi:hypothetical protein
LLAFKQIGNLFEDQDVSFDMVSASCRLASRRFGGAPSKSSTGSWHDRLHHS